MLFNSYYFIFLFLPIALTGYYLLLRFTKPDFAKIWLVIMSAWFYAYFSIPYLFLLIGSILFNYILCSRLWKKKLDSQGKSNLRVNLRLSPKKLDSQGKSASKRFLIIGIVCNLGLLFVFKYYNFFVENVNRLFQGEFNSLSLLLPLGISFYTFQEISFLADTYRGETPETKPIDFMLFILFFPQLVAGPIVSHANLLPNIRALTWKKVNPEEISKGIYLFSLGLFKKIILADSLGKSVAYGYENTALLNGPAAFLVVIAFALQLYLDFSGYSDMAIGLGRLFGFTLPMNFDRPYLASNIIDFWRRWHITLTAFLTKNVYIPLGGNRKGKVRLYVNLFLVFFISGLWHGAAWTYVLWGILNGITYIFTRMFLPQIKKIPVCLTTFFTFICAALFYGVFRSESLAQAGELFGRLLSGAAAGVYPKFLETFRWPEIWYVIKTLKLDILPWADYLCMGIIGAVLFSFLVFFEKPCMQSGKFEIKTHMAVISALMFIWSVISLSSVSVFLYFNF